MYNVILGQRSDKISSMKFVHGVQLKPVMSTGQYNHLLSKPGEQSVNMADDLKHRREAGAAGTTPTPVTPLVTTAPTPYVPQTTPAITGEIHDHLGHKVCRLHLLKADRN